MRLRLYVLRTLVWKDVARLVRNGPALMLLGLLVLVAFLVGSSGLVQDEAPEESATARAVPGATIVYWEEDDWVRDLRSRAPESLGIRFLDFAAIGSEDYTGSSCVIELRPSVYDAEADVNRRQVRYRYPGSDPTVLWPVTRWFLSASVAHFGEEPRFFETVQPLQPPPTKSAPARSALEDVTVADLVSLPLVGTALLTTIQFFAACGLLVSLTAQERERGALRALLSTPATFFELVLAKGVVHGGLALGTSALVVGALRPAVLGSPLFWATMLPLTAGYFAVGLLIASFAKNQAAPNLLSFAYLLMIGALNLMGVRFEAFRFLSSLTFERYGLLFTLTSLSNPDLGVLASLRVMLTTDFPKLVMLSTGLLLIGGFVGSRRMRAD